MFVAHRQEGSPGMNLIFLRWDSVVGVGIQLLSGTALCVQLAVQLRDAYLLRQSVTVFQHGMDVANRHWQAGKDYKHDNHSQGPARVLESHLRGLKRGRDSMSDRNKGRNNTAQQLTIFNMGQMTSLLNIL